MLINIVRCNIKHAAKSSQLIRVIAQLHHIVFNEIKDILIVNVKVQVQKVGIVENRRNDILNDTI